MTALAEQVQSGHEELARLQREEQAVEALVADLSRVLKDFPVDSHQHVDRELRGTLPWPVAGRMTVRNLETRTNGAPTAVHLNGVLIETARGAKVRAPSPAESCTPTGCRAWECCSSSRTHGNYLTLYGHAEVLYKSVGDSVAAGDTSPR